MTIASQLRAHARRYRELAQIHDGAIADSMRRAAERLDRQARALEAYEASARLTAPRTLALTA
jgi:hypothetical protein